MAELCLRFVFLLDQNLTFYRTFRWAEYDRMTVFFFVTQLLRTQPWGTWCWKGICWLRFPLWAGLSEFCWSSNARLFLAPQREKEITEPGVWAEYTRSTDRLSSSPPAKANLSESYSEGRRGVQGKASGQARAAREGGVCLGPWPGAGMSIQPYEYGLTGRHAKKGE